MVWLIKVKGFQALCSKWRIKILRQQGWRNIWIPQMKSILYQQNRATLDLEIPLHLMGGNKSVTIEILRL